MQLFKYIISLSYPCNQFASKDKSQSLQTLFNFLLPSTPPSSNFLTCCFFHMGYQKVRRRLCHGRRCFRLNPRRFFRPAAASQVLVLVPAAEKVAKLVRAGDRIDQERRRRELVPQAEGAFRR